MTDAFLLSALSSVASHQLKISVQNHFFRIQFYGCGYLAHHEPGSVDILTIYCYYYCCRFYCGYICICSPQYSCQQLAMLAQTMPQMGQCC